MEWIESDEERPVVPMEGQDPEEVADQTEIVKVWKLQSAFDLNNVTELNQINKKREKFKHKKWILSSQLVSEPSGSITSIVNPYKSSDIVGKVKNSTVLDVNKSIENANLVINSNLRKSKTILLKKLIQIKTYKGIRRLRGLPVRGQRTHTNAKTASRTR